MVSWAKRSKEKSSLSSGIFYPLKTTRKSSSPTAALKVMRLYFLLLG
jgi:hypothetical protein